MSTSNLPGKFDPPTPSFVIDVPLLEHFLSKFQNALDRHWPNSVLSYSFKTNSLPWLVSYLRRHGVWAEVVSDTEYELALALGYAPDRIVYNGPVKSRDRLRAALLEGSLVNLDAKREVHWVAELAREHPEVDMKVGLRVNWDLEARCPGAATTGPAGSRFGFNADNGELAAAMTVLREAGARVAGLHLHRNSRTQSLAVYQAAATVAAELIIADDLVLEWIDIGGGFFGGLDASPSFDDYIRVIRETLEPVVDISRTRLVVEPGGSLIAVPVEFHAGVIDVKKTEASTFVVTDGSRTNIDPLFRRRRPFEARLPSRARSVHPEQIVCGFTCMEDDHLLTLHEAPTLHVGDRIVFDKVGGAYTMCYQSMFIEYLPAVYVRTERSLTQVRRPWGG